MIAEKQLSLEERRGLQRPFSLQEKMNRLNCVFSEKEEIQVRRFILSMPVMTKRIYFYLGSSAKESRLKRIGDILLSYLYHPNDLLEISSSELLCYLEDAYLVSLTYELILNEFRLLGKDLELIDQELLEVIDSVSYLVEMYLPAETDAIKDMLLDSCTEVAKIKHT